MLLMVTTGALSCVPACLQIANSVMMRHFCELDAASRVKPRPSAAVAAPALGSAERSGSTLRVALSPASSLGATAAAATAAAGGFPGPSSSTHSYAPSWSGSEASDLLFGGDSSSSSQVAAEGGRGGAAPAGGSPARSHSQHHHQTPPRQHSAAGLPPAGSSDSQLDRSGRQESLLPATSGPVAGAAVGSGQLRLALPVQQRGAAKAAVRLLREQLGATLTDLHGEAWWAPTPSCSATLPAVAGPVVACTWQNVWNNKW
jgi:hypothetical protein